MPTTPVDPTELAAQTEHLRQKAHARNARRTTAVMAGKRIAHGGAAVSDDVLFEVVDEDPTPDAP